MPDGLSRGGVQDWLMQQGASAESVGLTQQQAETGGAFNEFLIGAGETLSDLIPGLRNDIRAPDTLAANVGRVAPVAAAGIGAGFAVPLGVGAVAAQAGIAGAFGTGRELAKAERTGEQFNLINVITDSAIAAATQGAFNVASRFVSGARRTGQAAATRQPIGFPRGAGGGPPGNLATGTGRLVRGGGGLDIADAVNRRAVNFAGARALGLPDDIARGVRAFGEDTLTEARKFLNIRYAGAAPTEAVAVGNAKEILNEVVEAGLRDPDIASVLRVIGESNFIPANAWQGIQRALRDAASATRRNPSFAPWARRVDDAISALDEGAAAAGGNKALLTEANQQYKLLATFEETAALVETGQIPAGQVLRALGRDTFKGFGRRALAEGGEAAKGINPAIRDFINVLKPVAKFTRESAGGSATAGRLLRFGGGGGAGVGAVVGGGVPGAAIGLLAGLALPPALGTAALGAGGGVLSRFAGPVAAQSAGRFLADEDETP